MLADVLVCWWEVMGRNKRRQGGREEDVYRVNVEMEADAER